MPDSVAILRRTAQWIDDGHADAYNWLVGHRVANPDEVQRTGDAP